ncbi:TspO/MBR family protein (plasmid) [Piscirickettsia salmonis]|nr:TspO/MBR family protein [Piscirickettsia salmonis]QGP57164.1 TspO/MBR family protein [Piscirickettsia salmonis]QGP61937.1 TspO/MBR family protein [Piscirickettsia salmonis]QGP66665.1 TspO/MBR family protein [Piscirickettsia salmonis]
MRKLSQLLIWIFVLQVVGFLMSQITKLNVDTWYQALQKSPLTPPNYVFGIAWTILYAMIAINGWLIWNQKKSETLTIIKKSFIIQLILNWAWTPLFFYCHFVLSSFVCLVFISIFTLHIIIKSISIKTLISALFVPYLIWLVFATYLNYQIWLLN